jgi:integrase
MVWDKKIPGLHVHVQSAKTKTYRFSYRFPGAPQALSYKLGRWPGLTLEAARAKARAAAQAVEDGLDPRTTDPKRTTSFWDLADQWHEHGLRDKKGNPRLARDASLGLVKYHTKAWQHRPAGTIAYAEVENLLAVLRDVKDQKPTAARLFNHLAALFNWARRTRRLPSNPIMGMKAPCVAESRKDKVERGELQWLKAPKSDEVLRDLWKLADELGDRFIKLLILTGKRLTAVRTMRWEAIDRESWLWTPPPGSPTKRNNPITLPALARRVLGPHQKEGPAFSLTEAGATQLQAVVRMHLGLPDFSWHNTRHIVVSGLARLKVAPHIARLAMDHAEVKDVHSDYEHVDWTPEVAAAMELWASHVEKLKAPGAGVLCQPVLARNRICGNASKFPELRPAHRKPRCTVWRSVWRPVCGGHCGDPAGGS